MLGRGLVVPIIKVLGSHQRRFWALEETEDVVRI
jgi:hypothetical protein